MSTDVSQRRVLDEAREWERTNGTTISEKSAQVIAKDEKLRSLPPATRHRGWLDMKSECDRLRAECGRLKAENQALRAELRSLKSKSKKPAAAKRRAA